MRPLHHFAVTRPASLPCSAKASQLGEEAGKAVNARLFQPQVQGTSSEQRLRKQDLLGSISYTCKNVRAIFIILRIIFINCRFVYSLPRGLRIFRRQQMDPNTIASQCTRGLDFFIDQIHTPNPFLIPIILNYNISEKIKP